jgi:hypothetical protein
MELPIRRISKHFGKDLIDQFEAICQKKLDFTLPDWIKKRLIEFEEIDVGTSLRYDNDRDHDGLAVEYWVEWKQLRLIMDKLCEEFEKIINRRHLLRSDKS